jgi:hypothetical protein
VALARGSTLALAALLDGQALWHAFVAHDLDAATALLRYLIAVPVSAVLLWVLRTVTGPYRTGDQPLRALASRLDDHPPDPTQPPATPPPTDPAPDQPATDRRTPGVTGTDRPGIGS